MLKYLLLGLLGLLTMGMVLAGGCGKDDPVGSYRCVGGELHAVVKDMSLVLAADGTLKLTGPMAVAGEMDLSGTWTQDGSQVTIVIAGEGPTDAEAGRYEDGKLIFEDFVWAKQ